MLISQSIVCGFCLLAAESRLDRDPAVYIDEGQLLWSLQTVWENGHQGFIILFPKLSRRKSRTQSLRLVSCCSNRVSAVVCTEKSVDNTWNTTWTEYKSVFRVIISCMLNMLDLFWRPCLTAWHVKGSRLFIHRSNCIKKKKTRIRLGCECVVCFLTVNYYLLSTRFTSVWWLG